MDLMICKSSLVCVPLPASIFKWYKSAVLLPIYKWIAIFDCPFANVKIKNVAAINSRTFKCKFSSFSIHFPPVETPLQKAPQPDFDASVCFTEFGSFCLSDLPLFNLKFSNHQRSSCFDRLFNTISGCYEQAWFSDCICCCYKCLSCRQYLNLDAWTAEDIRPINFVNSKTVVWGWERRFYSDISKLSFLSFPLLVPKSWCGYLFLGLKTLFVVMVSELIFLDLWQNPDVEGEKPICLGSLKLPLFFPSEEYRQDISLDECSVASVELLVPLIVFKISREQALIQNKGRETSKDFSTKEISQTFLSSRTVALRNRHLSELSCRENRFSREGISSNANLPFWNACME